MIKVEAVKTSDSIVLYFEQRLTTPEGMDELDDVYQALLGSQPRIGGYIDSNRFKIEVKDETED